MCNPAALLASLISWRQGVLEVKCLGSSDAKQRLWACCQRRVPARIYEVVVHTVVMREIAGSHAGQMLTFLQE